MNITTIVSSWNYLTTRHPELSLITLMNLFMQECEIIRKNLLKWMGVVLYPSMMMLQIIFTLFALNLYHINSKKMWNQTEIKSAYGDIVWNAMYTYPDWNKSYFNVNPCKRKTVTMSMRKDAIPNIDVKVWNRKSELPQGIFPMFLNTPWKYKAKTFQTYGYWLWSNRGLNYKDGTCWVKHCHRNKCYECWWYRRIWKCVVALTCNFSKLLSTDHNSKTRNNT